MVTPRFIILGLFVAQLADALTFAIGVSRIGIEYERNALAAALYAIGGIGGVMLLKVVGVAAAIGLLVFATRRFPRLLFFGGATGTSFGLLGFLANMTTVLTLA